MMINMIGAWIGFLLGCLSGAVTGLFFYDKSWLGGYASWQRRMTRLGHIAFFGLGLINLAFALSARSLDIVSGLRLSSILLLIGLATMSTLCFLSAWRPGFRHLFFVPAGSVTIAIALFVWRIVQP